MDVDLSLTSQQLDEEELQSLSREMMNTLNRETEVTASLAQAPAPSGARADAVTLGTILIAALGSSSLAALFNVARAYLERNPSLELEFRRQDGGMLTIKARNVGPEEIQETLGQAREFFEE